MGSKKFSLDWVLTLRRDELALIELELANNATDINTKSTKISQNSKQVRSLKDKMYAFNTSWQINSTIRAIEICEKISFELEEELLYLQKEREMILAAYSSKYAEIKLLEKSKEMHVKRELEQQLRKEESEINELSLIIKSNVNHD